MFASIAANAAVTVTPLGVNYGTKTVTFKVAWTGTPYNNRVWVWVDLCPVTGTTPATSFSTTTVSNPAKSGGNGTITGATARGFFIEYANATNAGTTVTAKLGNAPTGQFNWCAYGSDSPPNATVNAGGGYTLKGTKPFTINGNLLVNANTIGAGTCITSITDPTGRPDGFATPTLAVATSNPAARCGAGAVTLSATASGGTTTAMTYTWIVGSSAARTTTTGSLSHSATVGSTAYSVTVTNANSCTSTAKTGTVTVHNNFAAGAITTASGTATTGNNPNITIGNSTAATGGDGTITYQWRRSGTSSATFNYNYSTYPLSNSATNYATTGTYYFKRYAHDGTCNTAWAAASGQYTLTVAIATPPTAGTNTYTCGTQTWSEPIRIAACDKTSFTNSATTPDCRSYTYNSIKYYYYNQIYMDTYKTTMCPSPWRVPSTADFNNLKSCLGSNPITNVYYPESSQWGGALAGFIACANSLNNAGSYGYYHSTDGVGSAPEAIFRFSSSSCGVYDLSSCEGYQIRCVR